MLGDGVSRGGSIQVAGLLVLRIGEGGQSLGNKGVQVPLDKAQGVSVVRVGAKALEAIEAQL